MARKKLIPLQLAQQSRGLRRWATGLRKKTKGPLGPVLDLLSSKGLAVALLMMLFMLVLSATFHYKEIGEAGVKREYFEPWFADGLRLSGREIPLPFPGGRLVFSLLALNLLIGGLVRIRWSWRTSGIIVAHIGIVGLVLAGVVNFTLSDYGFVQVYEEQTRDYYKDYTEIEVAVWDASQKEGVDEFLIGDADVRSCAEAGRVFSSPDLPFDLELSGFLEHSQALPKGPNWEAASPVVEGWALMRLDDEDVDPHDVLPGLTARVTTDAGTQVGLLNVRDVCAWTVEAGGKTWAIHLHHARHAMPFELTVLDTTREDHPGTRTPRLYKSDVVYGEDARKATISMNQPLREQGHVLFQNSWGVDSRGEYSGFSVTRNPSDQWPKWSCWVILCGLLMTFSHRLYLYTVRQSRQHAKGA